MKKNNIQKEIIRSPQITVKDRINNQNIVYNIPSDEALQYEDNIRQFKQKLTTLTSLEKAEMNYVYTILLNRKENKNLFKIKNVRESDITLDDYCVYECSIDTGFLSPIEEKFLTFILNYFVIGSCNKELDKVDSSYQLQFNKIKNESDIKRAYLFFKIPKYIVERFNISEEDVKTILEKRINKALYKTYQMFKSTDKKFTNSVNQQNIDM